MREFFKIWSQVCAVVGTLSAIVAAVWGWFVLANYAVEHPAWWFLAGPLGFLGATGVLAAVFYAVEN